MMSCLSSVFWRVVACFMCDYRTILRVGLDFRLNFHFEAEGSWSFLSSQHTPGFHPKFPSNQLYLLK